MNILGISAFYHDSAAALLIDGKISAAAQEERFTRKKHDASFPKHAVQFCLDHAGLKLDAIDYIVFYDKPFLKFERLLETYLAYAPKGFKSFSKALPIWLKEKLFQKQLLKKCLRQYLPKFDFEKRLLFSEHHLSHAASAFYPSPFTKALVLTLDGVGEWATSSIALAAGNQITMVKEIHFPHSLGLLYSAFTYYLGFKVNSGEYKVMGLAPYGVPRYKDKILNHLIDIKADGSYRLNMKYFNYSVGLTMTNENFARLFAIPRRKPEHALEQVHMDLAASIQAVTEEVILRLAQSLCQQYPDYRNLCLAGGVALNCVANGKLKASKLFDHLWVQPAAGDAGGALGAALAGYHILLQRPRHLGPEADKMQGAYLGPEFADAEIIPVLESLGAKFTLLTDEELINQTAADLVAGRAIGWFQGRMEFGPRALGNRSIIADPRCPEMQTTLNLKVKYRESFRPFAPAVLSEYVSEWFEYEGDSPYMLMVAPVALAKRCALPEAAEALEGIEKLKLPRSQVPAITHVDYSARIQTVEQFTNPRFYGVIKRFYELTGVPMVINTSFNVRGEPIVNTPEDAFRCFMGTEIETLIIGNCYLQKSQQAAHLTNDYKNAFELD